VSLSRLARNPLLWVPVSAGLLILLVWRSRLWDAAAALAIVDPGALLLAVAVSAVIPVFWAARSADLIVASGHAVPVGSMIPMTVFANMINNLTPGSSGEVLRVWLLRAHHGVDIATGTAVVAIERLVAIGYLAGSAILIWVGHLWNWPPVVVLALVALLAVAPGAVYRVGLRPSAMLRAVPVGRVLGHARWKRVVAWMGRVDATIASLLVRPVRLGVFALLTFCVFAGYTAQLVLVGRALGVSIDPVLAWGALGIAITAGVISMLPFGLGSSDLVLVALLNSLGVEPALAAAVAIGYRIASTLPLGIGGVLAYAWLSASLPPGGAVGAIRAVREAGDAVEAPTAELTQ
jgi:glycosyltransferase 2 family protein